MTPLWVLDAVLFIPVLACMGFILYTVASFLGLFIREGRRSIPKWIGSPYCSDDDWAAYNFREFWSEK